MSKPPGPATKPLRAAPIPQNPVPKPDMVRDETVSSRLYRRVRPILFRLDPERAHHLATGSARLAMRLAPALTEGLFGYEHEALRQTLWGRTFLNPVGLAAGFDKNGRLVPFWKQLGFGFAEIGSVTAQASPGNPRPRLFRLPADQALINRMGLNNDGAETVAQRLRPVPGLPLGINLAKTHDPDILGEDGIGDFRISFRLLAPLADYIALNVSCPNTREGKTFETPDLLARLLETITAEKTALNLSVPVLVKLSPPPSIPLNAGGLLDELIRLCLEHGIQGLIASNTASDRQGLQTPAPVIEAIGRGGLSGRPLTERSAALVAYLYRATEAALPIIGVGGIDSAEKAYVRIRAGASLVQVYTGLVFQGPGLVRSIKQGLVRLLEQDGFASLGEAVGADSR